MSMNALLPILIALALGLFAVALAMIYLADESVRRRLFAAAGGRRSADAGVPNQGLDWLTRFGAQVQDRAGWKSPEDLGAMRLSLVRAGIYAPNAVEIFAAVRILFAMALGFAFGLLVIVLRVDNALLGALFVMIGAAIGLYMPVLLVKARGADRVQAVRLGLPDGIDLLVVCMEAGSSLTQGLQRVSQELKSAHPVLCEQLQITLLEMQAGASRSEALRGLGERAPDERLKTFITLLIQSDALGAGVGNTLRVFAEEMRKSRMIEAEHKAAELPVKISIPLVLCIFPCLMAIIFTPIIIRFIRILFQVDFG
jgi:tight adherence protein C